MTLRKLMSSSVTAVAGAAMVFLAVTSVEAAMLPPPADVFVNSSLQLVAGDCGVGFHRNLWGHCRPNAVPRRHCQPGFHAISFPNGSGYRCVHN
jgi:hypothetical protein